MDNHIKRWLIILEVIKSELIWSPYENDVLTRIGELIKEMEKAQDDYEPPMPNPKDAGNPPTVDLSNPIQKGGRIREEHDL